MPRLTVVDAPAVNGVGECFFKVEGMGSADSNFDELSFIDKQLKVVPASLDKYFWPDGSFKPASFFGCADEAILI